MKKYIPIALIALLAGTQISAIAGPMHDHAQQADMQATRDEMQKKMQDTNGMRGNMHAQMGDHNHGYMKDMPANSVEIQQRRQLMQEQMSK
jgi:hypothetical protein